MNIPVLQPVESHPFGFIVQGGIQFQWGDNLRGPQFLQQPVEVAASAAKMGVAAVPHGNQGIPQPLEPGRLVSQFSGKGVQIGGNIPLPGRGTDQQ